MNILIGMMIKLLKLLTGKSNTLRVPSHPHPKNPSGWRCGGFSLFLEEPPLFGFFKKIFTRSSETDDKPREEMELEFLTKPCRTCGRPISYNPAWKHIPNYCKECKAEFRKGTITRTCKRCGRTFTFPESVQHWPNYCQECRNYFRPVETVTRKCRGCGKSFTFPSNVVHWPNYCRECQAGHRGQRRV